jgi:hypothetical protein
MRLDLRANTRRIKIAAHRRYWRAECVILKRRRGKIRSNSLNLEQLASGHLTEARNRRREERDWNRET